MKKILNKNRCRYRNRKNKYWLKIIKINVGLEGFHSRIFKRCKTI
jgi:hypothetical protein